MDINSRIVIQDDVNQPAKIVVPSPSAIASGRDWTTIKGAHQGAVEKVECTTADIPSDRTFRNAWDIDKDASDPTYSGKRIKLNLPKGQEIAKDKIRETRAPVMSRLDVEYMQADEAGNSAGKSAAAAKKQTARDATSDARITAATNEVELKSAMEAIQAEIEAL